MRIRSTMVRLFSGITCACFCLATSIFLQSLFRLPAVYVVSIGALTLLACSLAFEHNQNIRIELMMCVVWCLFTGLYVPHKAVLVVLTYIGARLICEAASMVFSQVDKVFGVLVKYCLGSLLLTVMYASVLNVLWGIVFIYAVLLVLVQWFLFRRYDVLEGKVL